MWLMQLVRSWQSSPSGYSTASQGNRFPEKPCASIFTSRGVEEEILSDITLRLKVKALCSSEMPRTYNPVTQHYIPKKRKSQQPPFEPFKTSVYDLYNPSKTSDFKPRLTPSKYYKKICRFSWLQYRDLTPRPL
jgi:hypothetical protein